MLADEMNRCCSGLIATITSYIDARKPPTDNFFSFSLALQEAPSPSPRNNKALCFIEDPDESIVALSNHNHFIWKMFVPYNTALPSSVHIKGVFSVTVDVYTRKRGKNQASSFYLLYLCNVKHWKESNVKVMVTF